MAYKNEKDCFTLSKHLLICLYRTFNLRELRTKYYGKEFCGDPLKPRQLALKKDAVPTTVAELSFRPLVQFRTVSITLDQTNSLGNITGLFFYLNTLERSTI